MVDLGSTKITSQVSSISQATEKSALNSWTILSCLLMPYPSGIRRGFSEICGNGNGAEINRLTAAFVKNVKEPGKYPDGGGLWLEVKKSRTDPAKLNRTFRFERDGRDQWGPGVG